ncbi:MAG TPA: lysylphosphatidylglycerol synthase transmembrane domain-containing protein [Candidatus Dormibacteraeota bacterium]|nr:lysylphosphatidylglycerol synthase transmembrane domain-containing protein [Candidatus Dormibacteraeota bacterium]
MRLRLEKQTVARVALGAIALAALVLFLYKVPWRDVPGVLLRADPGILWAALAVNLVSLIAKGFAWYFLLRSSAPCRWRAVQEANFLGSAMNSLSVALLGETARVQDLSAREGAPVGAVAASVVRTRGIEALALACFMLLAPAILSLPPILNGLQISGGVLVLLLVAAAWSGKRVRLLDALPARVRTTLASITETGSPRLFALALFFALLNWVAQWATYHLILSAFGIPVSFSASFTALMVVNLSGLIQLSPGNIGVTQAAMILALLPFGVAPHEALAAGLALQAIQIPPVIVVVLLALGGRELAVTRGARPRLPYAPAIDAPALPDGTPSDPARSTPVEPRHS